MQAREEQTALKLSVLFCNSLSYLQMGKAPKSSRYLDFSKGVGTGTALIRHHKEGGLVGEQRVGFVFCLCCIIAF